MNEAKLNNIIEFLEELMSDSNTSKNVKNNVFNIIELLKSDTDKLIKINKVHDILDELHDDTNIDNFTRTQLWNVMSMIDTL
jgi:uncharacterized protein (UPF0147 family)